MSSYLTEAEWAAAFAQFGVSETLAYSRVTDTQLSLARHYGGANVNGASYLYIPATDELIRMDVFAWAEKGRSDALRAQAKAEAARQLPLI